MNSNISCLYESIILEQQVNYFILENKYTDLCNKVITEASDDKISKFKEFISNKYKKLKEIINKIITIIKKLLQAMFPYIRRSKKSKHKTISIETYNIDAADKYIDDAIKINYNIEKEVANSDKIKDEEIDEKSDELSNAEKEFSELKDPRSNKKEKQQCDIDEFDRYCRLFDSLKRSLEITNKYYDKDFKKMYNWVNTNNKDQDEFAEKRKKYQYIMSAYSFIVKIYTNIINVAKEICVDMAKSDDVKKDINADDIPEKEYDIKIMYMLDTDIGEYYECTGKEQIQKGKELHDKYPDRFILYNTIKKSRKDFIDHKILNGVDKLYDKYIK